MTYIVLTMTETSKYSRACISIPATAIFLNLSSDFGKYEQNFTLPQSYIVF
jgi:hypothetical protein